jgi:hypothetical protein
VIINFYSLFRVTASASFLGCAILACSSGPLPTTVPLESVAVRHDSCRRIAGSRAAPAVYECKTGQTKVFATTLKDCSIPEKFTFQTTTRQLFVGLLGLRVISQDAVQLGHTRALQTVVTGTLDAEPVVMSAFTFRQRECVTDIVLWQGSESEQVPAEKILAFTQSSTQLTTLLLDSSFSVQQDADITG